SNPSVKPGQKNPIDSNTIRSSSLRDYTPRACAHKSAPCKRGSVNVRFAPKATELLRCRKTSPCANFGLLGRTKTVCEDHLRKTRCTTPKAGLESVADVVDIYQQATRRQR